KRKSHGETNAANATRDVWRLVESVREWLLRRWNTRLAGENRQHTVHPEQLSRIRIHIVSGGNNTVATTGDPIIQPGLIDVNCNKNNAQTVGTLVKKSSLPNSNVDCSIAQISSGMVRTDGAILEIGTISSSTVSAAINQAVKKSGRTTGLSYSAVAGLNATVSVTYAQ